MAFSRRLELKTIHKMLSIYCHDMHGSTRGKLCPTCRQLLEYAGQRLVNALMGKTSRYVPNARYTAIKQNSERRSGR